ATPIAAASAGDIQITGPPRNSRSMCRLSWYSEWIDHFECGVRYRTVTSGRPLSGRPCSPEVPPVIKRRPVGRQGLAVRVHPVVVEEEVHPPGQRVPWFLPLHVHHERRVATAAGLAAGPLRRRYDGPGLHLGIGERDPVPGTLGGQVGQVHSRSLLQFLPG